SQERASLCPACFKGQPMPRSLPPPLLTLSDTLLEGAGYRLELLEHRMTPRLAIERLAIEPAKAPATTMHEPGAGLTRLGGLTLVGGPLALVLFVVSLLLVGSRLPIPLTLLLNVGLDLILAGALYYYWPPLRPGRDRLVDAA